MAYFQEASRWTPTIYRIERNDPLMGGEFGINNVQARQLANRTQYLLEYFLKLHEVDGTHKLTEAAVPEDAELKESSFALARTTSELKEELDSYQLRFDDLIKAINNVASMSGTTANALYKALLLSWDYSDASYDFCLFNKLFNFTDQALEVRVHKTVAADDSIDVDTQDPLIEGECYVLSYDGGAPQVVTIDELLDTNRVTLKEDLKVTLGEEAGATLKRSTWKVIDSVAHVVPGDILLTRSIDTLQNYSVGIASIQHRKYDTKFRVHYRYALGETWRTATYLGTKATEDGTFSSTYSFVAGAPVLLQIVAEGTDIVEHMAAYADVSQDIPAFVRTPAVQAPLKIERFGALYNDEFDSLEVVISDSINFETTANTRRFVFRAGNIDMTPPQLDLRDLIHAEYPIIEGKRLYWYATYTSKRGYSSEPSKVISFIVE